MEELDLRGEELTSAHTELLIKILSTQYALLSLLADKFEGPEISSNEIYKSVVLDASKYAVRILKDLSERRGYVDINSLLP